MEADYRLALNGWTLGLNGSLQKPKNEETGERLLRRARKSATADLVRSFGAHRLGVQVQAVGDRRDVDFSSVPSQPVKNGGYALVHLTGELALPHHFRLSAKVENLLDKEYTTVFGYRQSGIATYGTLRWSW